MTIVLPTGESVSTRESGGEHYQRVLPVKDGPNGPIPVSDIEPFVTRLQGQFFDAFARLRASSITTLGDFKQVVNTHNPLIWSEKTTGGGNSIYVQDVASQRLQVGTGASDGVVRQTKRYYRYSPGKSALVMFTGVFRQGQNNTIKRMGYFDGSNGMFFQQTVNGMECVVRSSSSGSVVDDVVPQHNWNLDTMDGTGKIGVDGESDGANPSGITLDNKKGQIHVIDFSWLGFGKVRFGYLMNGEIHYVHQFRHANLFSRVYTQTPNLPMRFEIFNTNIAPAAATMDQTCFAVLLEDGFGSDGIKRTADTGITGRSFDGNLTPILSIRLNANNLRATIVDLCTEILASAEFRWAALLNPTFTDSTPPSWVTPPNSVIEYDVTREGAITNEGTLLCSGYAPNKAESTGRPVLTLADDIGIYSDIDGVPDQFCIAAQKVSGGSDTANCTLHWRELI